MDLAISTVHLQNTAPLDGYDSSLQIQRQADFRDRFGPMLRPKHEALWQLTELGKTPMSLANSRDNRQNIVHQPGER